MKAKIYRGSKEIGGTCVELKAENGKILWIDLGAPLDKSDPNIDYAKNKVDALLISHPHQDHFGLMEEVGDEVPIYIGQLSLYLINATRIFRGLPQLKGNYIIFKPWEAFTLLDTFRVTSFLTDHSTPESFAFQIEADGIKVFYSGDFRATGRKSLVFDKLINNPPKNIDLLFMEGTMVERANHSFPTESSVEEGIYQVIKEQKNVSFVISSAQNIDRFVSVFRAVRRLKKYLVIDIYTAWILEMIKKQSKNIPQIEWDEIKVYNNPRQLEKIRDASFDEFRNKVTQQEVGSDVFKTPGDFVYFVRQPNRNFLDDLRKHGTINVIYSQWEGYLKEEHKTYFTDYVNELKNDPEISYNVIHTSGHATVPDLVRFAKAINARKIVPIHTAYPEKFREEFERTGMTNIILWDDNIVYQL